MYPECGSSVESFGGMREPIHGGLSITSQLKASIKV